MDKKLNLYISGILMGLIIISIPLISFSQMFSIEEPARRVRPAGNAFLLGMSVIDMSYRGDKQDNSNIYSVHDPVYSIRLNLPGIELYGNFRTNIGDADTLNYLNFGAHLSGAMPITGNSHIGLLLPLWLSPDFIRMRSGSSTQREVNQFRQSSVSIGVGAGAFYRFSRNIRIRAEFVPQVGFTVSALGSDSGQVTSLNGSVKWFFDHILGRYGLIFGYNYKWKRYSGGDEMFRYDINANNINFGITF